MLAVDCSDSVDEAEFRLQIEGLAEAFESPDIAQATQAGPNGRIAIAMLEWSDAGNAHTVVPWTLVGDQGSARELAATFRAVRRVNRGVTSLSGALVASMSLQASLPARTGRRVIDISTDGTNNNGPRPDEIRDRAVDLGIVVNGLTILTDVPYLDAYFANHVKGGKGSFVIKANDYGAYHDAIKRKLLREIAQPIV